MKSTLVRFVCRLLIVCMAVLPFQAGAGMVGTGESVAALHASPREARAALEQRLQAYGIAADFAKERVAALSDAEVQELAGRVDRLPAGANGAGVGMIAVLLFLIWRFILSQDAATKK